MKKEIRPGMLCLITGLIGKCHYPEHDPNGRIVEVVRRAVPDEIFTSVKGSPLIKFVPSSPNVVAWVIKANEYLSWEECLVNERVVNESRLIPISDPDIDISEVEQKEKENDYIIGL